MASPLTVLGNLIRTARNAETHDCAAFNEALAFAFESETIDALAPGQPGGAEGVRRALEGVRERGSAGSLLALIESARKATREGKRDVEGAAAQALADTLGVTSKVTPEGYELDVDALFALAKAGNVAGYVGFTLPGQPEGNMLDVSVRQLRELAREAKAQRWHVTARLVRGHKLARPVNRFWPGDPATILHTEPGWCLVVEWLRASGARGTLRLRHNRTFAGKAKCAAVVHVGLAENTNAHAA